MALSRWENSSIDYNERPEARATNTPIIKSPQWIQCDTFICSRENTSLTHRCIKLANSILFVKLDTAEGRGVWWDLMLLIPISIPIIILLFQASRRDGFRHKEVVLFIMVVRESCLLSAVRGEQKQDSWNIFGESDWRIALLGLLPCVSKISNCCFSL